MRNVRGQKNTTWSSSDPTTSARDNQDEGYDEAARRSSSCFHSCGPGILAYRDMAPLFVAVRCGGVECGERTGFVQEDVKLTNGN